MERREFFEKSGAAVLAAAALAIKGYTSPVGFLLRQAQASTGLPLESLKAALDRNEALLLVPTDAQYASFQNAFNLRTALKPQVRVLVKSEKAVMQLVQWLRANPSVAFAVRGGGHSYEGFSQSSSLVIDTRLMNQVVLSADGSSVSIGGGTGLMQAYQVLGAHGLAIPAGSCPTVGVSGHSLGGGFGELGRPLGLACDSFENVELVDAEGNLLQCNERENSDLFWALRGGGGGSFGVATRYQFRTHRVKQVIVYRAEWKLPAKRAAALFTAWQKWIPHAAAGVSSIFHLSVDKTGMVTLKSSGQTVGSEAQLRAELAKISPEKPTVLRTQVTDFLGSIRHFAGQMDYPVQAMKAKSDYIYKPVEDAGCEAIFDSLRTHPGVAAMYDGYGAAVAAVKPEDTAFFHRNAICCVQYVHSFPIAASAQGVEYMRSFYNGFRPYMSGYAYVNYPDLDLGARYGEAYWGENFARLRQVKASVDANNFFRHAQSIPL